LPPVAVKQLPPPETVRLFFLRDAKYTDTSDKLILIRRFTDADVPPAIAARARHSGIATGVADPRRKKLYGLQGTKGSQPPDPATCESLDPPAPSGVVEPIKHSAFEPLDRGPPIIGRIPRERVAQ
jgi:hypothetical protein